MRNFEILKLLQQTNILQKKIDVLVITIGAVFGFDVNKKLSMLKTVTTS